MFLPANVWFCEYTDIAHSRSTTRTDLSIRNLTLGDGRIAPFDNNWSYAFNTGSAAPLQAETRALATSSSPTASTPEFNLSYRKTQIHKLPKLRKWRQCFFYLAKKTLPGVGLSTCYMHLVVRSSYVTQLTFRQKLMQIKMRIDLHFKRSIIDSDNYLIA